MSDPGRTVFLSYASQDAQAAQKICEALRAAGIQVFLDQSELRGGDAWDQKIRHEIHDCALFVPLISAHSNARHEGYFRREWRLAVERTGDMSDRVAFLVPVVIDGTRDFRAALYRSAFDRCSGRACREARHLQLSSNGSSACCPRSRCR